MAEEASKRGRGRPPKPGGPMSGAEKQRRYMERLKAAAAQRAQPQAKAPTSLDLEALREILREGRRRMSVGHQQVEWLHEGISPDTPAEITGPAWQLRFAVISWKELIEQVESWARMETIKSRKRP